jgi:hypothetical protein
MGVKRIPGEQSRYMLRCHLIAASVTDAAFAAPSLLLLTALRVIEPELAVFLGLIFLLASPFAGAIAWLIDRGSRGENGVAAMKVIGAMPGRLYGLLLGAFFGNYVGGPLGAGVGAILLYLSGRAIGLRVGSSISLWLAGHCSQAPT